MKPKCTKIRFDLNTKSNVPLFYGYIDIFEKNQKNANCENYDFAYSEKIQGYAIIEPPSKLISSIIDYGFNSNKNEKI